MVLLMFLQVFTFSIVLRLGLLVLFVEFLPPFRFLRRHGTER